MTQTMTTSRIRRYELGPRHLLFLLEQGNKLEVFDGLPPGCRIMGYVCDYRQYQIHLYVSHESFDLVREGHEMPLGPTIKMRKILDDKNSVQTT